MLKRTIGWLVVIMALAAFFAFAAPQIARLLSDIALQGMLRDGIYMVAAGAAFAFIIWMVLKLLGFPYAKIQATIDGNAVAIAIVFAAVTLGSALVVSGVVH